LTTHAEVPTPRSGESLVTAGLGLLGLVIVSIRHVGRPGRCARCRRLPLVVAPSEPEGRLLSADWLRGPSAQRADLPSETPRIWPIPCWAALVEVRV